jgi:hypothetical protein
LKDLIYEEYVKYASQYLEDKEEYLNDHKYARANDLKRNPIRREEINTLLAIIITMGKLGYPTIRFTISKTKH